MGRTHLDTEWSVGEHRLAGEPGVFVAGQRLFTFLP